MTHEQLANVEHVADIKELEELLNDTIAKKRVNFVFHVNDRFHCLFFVSINND